MSQMSNSTSEEHGVRNRATEHLASQDSGRHWSGDNYASYGRMVLGNVSLGRASNSAVRANAMQTMQGTHGNRAVQRFLQGGSQQRESTPGGTQVAVQRSEEFPFEDMFPEQAYDTPTEEEMAKLEEMYQKGLAEDTAAEAGTTAAEAGTTAAEVGTTAAEAGTVAAEGGVVAAEGGVAAGGTAAGGLGAGAILPLAAAGLAGFGVGTAIGKYGIDPYLNRPHMENVSDIDENYKDSWAYKINQMIDD